MGNQVDLTNDPVSDSDEPILSEESMSSKEESESTEEDSPLNKSYDPKTGHKTDCCRKIESQNKVRNGVSARCGAKTADGEECSRQMPKQSCLTKINGNLYGMCPIHYKSYCNHGKINFVGGKLYKDYKTTNWVNHLSWCANKRCDEMRLSRTERRKINKHNIRRKLGLPSSKLYNHLSSNNRKNADEDDSEDSFEEDSESISKSSSEEDSESSDEQPKRVAPKRNAKRRAENDITVICEDINRINKRRKYNDYESESSQAESTSNEDST